MTHMEHIHMLQFGLIGKRQKNYNPVRFSLLFKVSLKGI